MAGFRHRCRLLVPPAADGPDDRRLRRARCRSPVAPGRSGQRDPALATTFAGKERRRRRSERDDHEQMEAQRHDQRQADNTVGRLLLEALRDHKRSQSARRPSAGRRNPGRSPLGRSHRRETSSTPISQARAAPASRRRRRWDLGKTGAPGAFTLINLDNTDTTRNDRREHARLTGSSRGTTSTSRSADISPTRARKWNKQLDPGRTGPRATATDLLFSRLRPADRPGIERRVPHHRLGRPSNLTLTQASGTSGTPSPATSQQGDLGGARRFIPARTIPEIPDLGVLLRRPRRLTRRKTRP